MDQELFSVLNGWIANNPINRKTGCMDGLLMATMPGRLGRPSTPYSRNEWPYFFQISMAMLNGFIMGTV
ncbi:hypothetical protein HNQ81_003351 [Desulfoprunum benzoelyticum]|uniref:Uncharacterized protein n=1 Tax=Desulfoprunum benzoelyticum TaxID=1506996 RepID=A0A840UV74_9BACT|nr:hypothetical protein [Desulfoprunum benzoelyticum]